MQEISIANLNPLQIRFLPMEEVDVESIKESIRSAVDGSESNS